MHTQQWHQFLQDSATLNASGSDQDIVIENGKLISFGDPVAERSAVVNETVMCDLSHLGLLKLSGADTLSFLQGQVTNDIKLLNGHNAHYTAYCNPKGRMLALFLAFLHHDHMHLQMPKELIEPIAKRLKMYVMRSKVVIEDVSEPIIKIGLNGHNAAELLKSLFSIGLTDKVPQNDYELVNLENATLLKLPGTTARYEIFTDAINAPIIWNALKLRAKPVGAAGWEWLEIQAGIPEIMLKTQEAFVPQMLNLDLLGGISFKKGCYTGQEIVARTHYLGTVKRRTHLGHINTLSQPNVGGDVLNQQHEVIGKIVRCAPSPTDGYDVLAEIRLENVEAGSLFVNDNALEIQQLPYKF